MMTKENLKSYQTAFENFMQDIDEVDAAIIASTEAGYEGGGCSLEILEDGTYQLLWDKDIGDHYRSEGIIIGIPQLSAAECEAEYFDDAIESLENNWKKYLTGLDEWE